jgi:ATP-dependent 26S proteasome regulatory subunit
LESKFGVICIKLRENERCWYCRYAVDPAIKVEAIILPDWLFSHLNGPVEADIEFLTENEMAICEEVIISLHPAIPAPCELVTIKNILLTQLIGQVIFKGCIIPVSVYGRLITVSCQLDTAGCSLFNSSTKLSIKSSSNDLPLEELPPFLSGLQSELEHGLTLLSRCASDDLLLDVVPNCFVLQGLDFNAERQLLSMLAINYPMLKVPLNLILQNEELEGFEDEHANRAKILNFWADTNIVRQDSLYILHLDGVESVSMDTLKFLMEFMNSHRQCAFLIPVMDGNHLSEVIPRSQVLTFRQTGIMWDIETTFVHRFNTEYLKMSLEASEEAIIEVLRNQEYEKIGAVMRKGLSSWEDIQGYDSVTRRLRELVQNNTQHSSRLQQLGILPTNGILLHGPSGCGKTEMIKALANDSVTPVIQLRSTDILSKYLGESESQLRIVFAKARKVRPCILFIDNIEVLGARRGIGSDSTGSHDRLLSTLLNEMDGIVKSEGVLVIGCTNRVTDLDEALLRPGRLDHHIEVPLPQAEGIKEILLKQFERLHIRVETEIVNELSRLFVSRSPATVKNILNEYALDCLEHELPLSAEPLLSRAGK